MDKSEYISASELGDYVYCKRGWWLRQQGLLPTTFEMQQGTAKHENLLMTLLRIKKVQTILLWAGIIVLIVIILLLLLFVS